MQLVIGETLFYSLKSATLSDPSTMKKVISRYMFQAKICFKLTKESHPESMSDFMFFCQNHGNRAKCPYKPSRIFSEIRFFYLADDRGNFVYDVLSIFCAEFDGLSCESVCSSIDI